MASGAEHFPKLQPAFNLRIELAAPVHVGEHSL